MNAWKVTRISTRIVKDMSSQNSRIVRVRDSYISGRFCFSSQKYHGTCQIPGNCVKQNFSYSKTCGWNLVCCELAKGGNKKISRTRGRPNRTIIPRKSYPKQPKSDNVKKGPVAYIVSFENVQFSNLENLIIT